MLFSVIIPTYNRMQFLPRTLDCVWRQTFKDFEVIVVDDGSRDRTLEYLRGLGDKVRVITQHNRGVGAARNMGLREARGDYIAFLDSDDYWFPWTLEIFARSICSYGQPHILGGSLLEFVDEAEVRCARDEPLQALWFPDFIAASRYSLAVGSGTCVLRRDGLLGCKFLEDRLNAEDHDMILQLGTRPGFVQIATPFTLGWRRHSKSETANSTSTSEGLLRLLRREQLGEYPGGMKRRRERLRIIMRHIRPAALACLRHGEVKCAWNLYISSVRWNLALGHLKFVLGLPLLLAMKISAEFARFSR